MAEFGHNTYIQIPPDSSGKKVFATRVVELQYTAGTHDFTIGDFIIGNTSGFVGSVVEIEEGGASGEIYVIAAANSPVSDLAAGEDIYYDGGKVAEVSSTSFIYVNNSVVTSHDNPFWGQNVARSGSAQIRYQGGEQQLDAFGLTRVSEPRIIAEYNFSNTDLPLDVTNTLVGGGTVTRDADQSVMDLDVGTANGDSAIMSSDMYHIYETGLSRTIMLTVASGDTGKINVVRRWGYFDGDDGVFFQLDGTVLSLVLRTSTTGSPVDTVIDQSAWNIDRIDGSSGLTNQSQFNLDASLLNLYWIDVAWLGAGPVRAGVYAPDGTKIVCHRFENGNTNPYPYMKRASLPVRAEIFNSAIIGSPSRLKFACATVFTDGDVRDDKNKRYFSYTGGVADATAGDVMTPVPILSFRPASTYYGQTNRIINTVEQLSLFVKDDPVWIKLWLNGTLTGASWSAITGAPMESDTSATALSGAVMLTSWMFDPGSHILRLDDVSQSRGLSLYLRADETAPTLTLTADTLDDGTNSNPQAIVTTCCTWFAFI